MSSRAAPDRRREPRPSSLAAGVTLVAAALLAASALGEEDLGGADQPRVLASSKGHIAVTNSKQGRAVVSGSDLRPGQTLRGRVRIGNASGKRAKLSLRRGRLHEAAGLNGGALSQALIVKIKRLGGGDHRRLVYRGRLARLRTVRLGLWRPWATRRYRINVRFPADGQPRSPVTGDNRYQGSRTRFRLVWQAVAR